MIQLSGRIDLSDSQSLVAKKLTTVDKLREIKNIKNDLDTRLMNVIGLDADEKPEASTGVENGKIFEKRLM